MPPAHETTCHIDDANIIQHGISLRYLQSLARIQSNADTLERIGIRFPVNADSLRAITKDQARALLRWQSGVPND